jgi:predicted transcriptional regulator
MPYNKQTDKQAGYISHEHKRRLDALCAAHRRTKRAELEWLIDQAVQELDREVIATFDTQ